MKPPLSGMATPSSGKRKAPLPAPDAASRKNGEKRLVERGKTKIQNLLRAWFLENGRDLPWRKTRDPYAILISEVMLQQTQVASVIPFYVEWMKKFPGFPALAAASEAEVLRAWEGLGYYSRARNLHRTARAIEAEYGGVFPSDREVMMTLPGVGRYTAGAVATFAYDQATPIVDANVARVVARLWDIRKPIDSGAGRKLVWEKAEALVPVEGAGVFNEALMELGALVCTPRAPKCIVCPVKGHCLTSDPEALPIKKPRPATIRKREACALILSRRRVLLRQSSGRWRGLWILPPLEKGSGKPLASLEYPFTHHQITLEVYAAAAPAAPGPGEQWFLEVELQHIALPSPHRRALREALRACNVRR